MIASSKATIVIAGAAIPVPMILVAVWFTAGHRPLRARATLDDLWQKRFEGDLVQVMTEMKHPPGQSVTLRMRDAAAGVTRELEDVVMTRENRQRIWRARNDVANRDR